MKRVLKLILIAYFGLAVLTFGLFTIVGTANPLNYQGQIVGHLLLIAGFTIFVCSGVIIFKKKKQ